ncbi:MAG: hypothetical protein M5T61_21075 [Acidimicrobiia bacterium]|nr:hypothetical protein [Acidimicrobiia bacterium]
MDINLRPALAEAVREHCAASEAAAWRLIETLVNIDSSPEDHDGLERVIEIMEASWLDLGFEVSTLRTRDGLPIVDARRAAQSADPNVLVLAHLDTVFPRGTANERPFRLTADGEGDGARRSRRQGCCGHRLARHLGCYRRDRGASLKRTCESSPTLMRRQVPSNHVH